MKASKDVRSFHSGVGSLKIQYFGIPWRARRTWFFTNLELQFSYKTTCVDFRKIKHEDSAEWDAQKVYWEDLVIEAWHTFMSRGNLFNKPS